MEHTYAGRRVWLPEEPILDLHAGDLGLPLQGVPWVTLEDDGVAGFFAVSTPGPVLRNPWVVAGCGSGNWEH